MDLINRDSPIPLYFQLKNILLEKIQHDEWKSGEMIPSEQELQEHYGLSRTTVRQTLSDLVTEGYLIRQRGRGTFIARPKVDYDPSKSLELNDYMKQQGVNLGWRVISQEWIAPPASLQADLKTAFIERVYRIMRLRLADGDPIGYHAAYIPASVFPFIDEEALVSGGSLDYLLKHPQMHHVNIRRTLEATLANDLDANLLYSEKGDPILSLDRWVFGENEAPIEFLQARFRGDRFKYTITL